MPKTNPLITALESVVAPPQRSLSDFACGYIAALATLVHSEGTSTSALEMFEDIGRPTPEDAEASGLSQFECDALKACALSERGEG
jgi:hypothetical protein